MNRILIFILIVLFTLALMAALIGFGSNLTGASVTGQTKCVGAKAALKFINEKGCTRIYEDPSCGEKGLVEIKC